MNGPSRAAGGVPLGARMAIAVLVGLVVLAFLNGRVGLVLGGVSAVAVARRLASGGRRAEHARGARMRGDLPLALDLLASCLAAGSAPERAAVVVADAVGGPVGAELARVARLADLGADPARCWRGLVAVPELAPLGRAASAAVSHGAPLADVVARIADEQATAATFEARSRMQRAAVRLTAPLGLCFLPAFLLLGVAPLVAGLFGSGGLTAIRP